jgi:hypothetical protein
MCVCAAVRSVMMTGPSVAAAAASVIEGVGALVRNQRCSIPLSQIILPQGCLGFYWPSHLVCWCGLRFKAPRYRGAPVYARTTAGKRPENPTCTGGKQK